MSLASSGAVDRTANGLELISPVSHGQHVKLSARSDQQRLTTLRERTGS